MTVTKRDERVVEFDKDKIIKAVEKAFESLGQDGKEVAQKIADEIEQSNKNYDVEEIQNIVERKLMQSKHKDVAKAYVEYRYLHSLIRQSNTTDKSIKELINGESEYWNTENSNKNPRVVTTQRDYIAGITSVDIARRFLLPKDVVKAHDEGILHFHKKIVA